MEYKYYGSTSRCNNNSDSEKIPLCVSYEREYRRATIFGMCKTSFLFFVYFVLYVTFLASGAAIFSALEAPGEEVIKFRLENAIAKFRVNYPGVQGQFASKGMFLSMKILNRWIKLYNIIVYFLLSDVYDCTKKFVCNLFL